MNDLINLFVIISFVLFLSACDQQVEQEAILSDEQEATPPVERAVSISDEAFNLARHPVQGHHPLHGGDARDGAGVGRRSRLGGDP